MSFINITNIVIHIFHKILINQDIIKITKGQKEFYIFVRPWRIELQPEHWQCPDLPLIDDRNLIFILFMYHYNILIRVMQFLN